MKSENQMVSGFRRRQWSATLNLSIKGLFTKKEKNKYSLKDLDAKETQFLMLLT
jgi:hypothetical protein